MDVWKAELTREFANGRGQLPPEPGSPGQWLTHQASPETRDENDLDNREQSARIPRVHWIGHCSLPI